jgi:hypothetical protein
LSYSQPTPKQNEQPAERKSSAPDEEMFKNLSARAKEVGDSLGKQLQGRYENWLESRRWIEEDWLRAVRAYHGVYDYDTKSRFSPNQSDVFVQLSRMKTDTVYNRICDMMLGPEDHWAVKPSPMADVSDERREELKQQIMQASMVNPDLLGMSQQEPTEEELDSVEDELAKKAAKRMGRKIRDQLEFVRYRKHFRQTSFEMCVVGTGVFKGPMVGVEKRPKWKRAMNITDIERSDNGSTKINWALQEQEEVLPKIDSPSLFDVYPDPYTTETAKGLGVFERHVMLAHQLEDLASQPYFISDQIDMVRDNFPKGNHWDNYTDLELRFVSGQNETSEHEMRYDVIEYWGWVTGQELIQAGLNESQVEMNKSYYANVWHCGGITIRATVSPNRPVKSMYKLVPYKEVIHSQYGVGVPFLMRDSQETVNAAARELINNAALSSGPQVEVAIDLIELDANENIREIVPWRVWPRAGGDLAHPAVRFTNIPDNTESMAKIIQIFRAFADEESNIPSYSHGSTQLSGAAGKTASGMSMLMGAASMDVKGVVQNLDQYLIKPFIEEMYHFNMQWSDDESIKGDMEPEATGSSTLLAKEIKSQRALMMLQITNNATDMPLMGPERRAKMLRATGEALDFDPDDIAPDPDEEDIINLLRQQQPPQPGMNAPVPGQPVVDEGAVGGPTPAGSPPSQPGAEMTPGGPGTNQGQAPVAPITGQ